MAAKKHRSVTPSEALYNIGYNMRFLSSYRLGYVRNYVMCECQNCINKVLQGLINRFIYLLLLLLLFFKSFYLLFERLYSYESFSSIKNLQTTQYSSFLWIILDTSWYSWNLTEMISKKKNHFMCFYLGCRVSFLYVSGFFSLSLEFHIRGSKNTICIMA